MTGGGCVQFEERTLKTCVICNGTGRTATFEEQRINPEISASAYASHLCVCRQSLPPREGKADWWSLETVFSGRGESAICDPIQVTVKAEVPISADNYRVHRRGNRSWPTMVDVDCGEPVSLWPEQARKLAALLIQAADAADAVDKPDTDVCGHWFPCDCPAT